mgnify:CR=1 FL=1
MKFDILTLFPEVIDSVLKESIIGRAQEKGILDINAVNIREFSKNKHKKADDYPYGGGGGMIMTAQPVYDAYLSIIKDIDYKPKVIYLSPQGRVLTQEVVKELSTKRHIVLLCGHYEGIDERIIEEIVDEEVSIGDYVLTGGELPAMVLIDSVSRLIPGVLSNEDSYSDESHYDGLLEYPHYTRPVEFNNRKVPDVLLSGHHANITRWRRKETLKRTCLKRPDLFEKFKPEKDDKKLIKEMLSEIEKEDK